MPNQFIATVFELTDSAEIDAETALQAIENVIVAAAPSLFVGRQRQALANKLKEIIGAMGDGTLVITEATATTSQILRAAIERSPALVQLIEPVGMCSVDMKAI